METAIDLELRGVVKKYGGTVAVDGVSLQVQQGEFLFLLGPSGCGKTTTLRLIAGFIEPDAGSIAIRGEEMTHVPTFRRGLGMVFQSYALFPHMTVFDNVAFGLKMRKMPRSLLAEKVEAVLELVRLGGYGERYPRQLSGGQQQRIALARALVIEPTLLLLDEPLSNIDLKLRQEMRLELKALQEKLRVTTIFVTHDQEEALVMANRIAIMNRGRIEQLGSATDLYDNPRNPFIAHFIGESNFFEGVLARHLSDSRAIAKVGGLEIEGRTGENIVEGSKVAVAVRPEKIQVLDGAGPGTNRYPGAVEAVIYLGAFIRYQVRLPAGDLCTAQASNSRGAPVFFKGQTVRIEWDPEDCLIMARE